MDKNELKTLARAASTIFFTVGDGLKAHGKFREGKGWETAGYSIRAGYTIHGGWDDIAASWDIIYDHSNRVYRNVESRFDQIQRATTDFVLGTYGGLWGTDDGSFHTLDHDSDTNLSNLTWKRKNGGYTFYKGKFLNSQGKFIWTGFNAANRQVSIIGTPSWNRSSIHSMAWLREGDNLIYIDTEEMSKLA